MRPSSPLNYPGILLATVRTILSSDQYSTSEGTTYNYLSFDEAASKQDGWGIL